MLEQSKPTEKQMKHAQEVAEAKGLEVYTTGTGQVIFVHKAGTCKGDYCAIHNPSTNTLSNFPTHWRADRGIMERICPGGVGHPDFDDMDFHIEILGESPRLASTHGCCGICRTGGCEQCGIYLEPYFEEYLG